MTRHRSTIDSHRHRAVGLLIARPAGRSPSAESSGESATADQHPGPWPRRASKSHTSSSLIWSKFSYQRPTARNGSGVIEADAGISDRLKLTAGGRGRRGNGHDDPRRLLPPQGPHRRAHGRARRQTVVDQDHDAPRNLQRPAATPIEQLARDQFHPLPRNLRLRPGPRESSAHRPPHR